jgi:hypothetical protein
MNFNLIICRIIMMGITAFRDVEVTLKLVVLGYFQKFSTIYLGESWLLNGNVEDACLAPLTAPAQLKADVMDVSVEPTVTAEGV